MDDRVYDYDFNLHKQPPMLSAGESSSNIGEAYINGLYAGLSFRSLLTSSSSHPPEPLQPPKSEPLFNLNDSATYAYAPPYSFFLEPPPSPPPPPSFHQQFNWQQIPNLLPLLPPQHKPATTTAESLPLYPKLEKLKQAQRRRRQRLSDKTRTLQKLMPLEEGKKTDMASVLEESYKYIKFLQAQVSILQSMPYTTDIGYGIGVNEIGNVGGFGDLGRLNRQELLKVVLNSSVAQRMLYSNGCGVYSLEQLTLLKNNAERKAMVNTDSNFEPILGKYF